MSRLSRVLTLLFHDPVQALASSWQKKYFVKRTFLSSTGNIIKQEMEKGKENIIKSTYKLSLKRYVEIYPDNLKRFLDQSDVIRLSEGFLSKNSRKPPCQRAFTLSFLRNFRQYVEKGLCKVRTKDPFSGQEKGRGKNMAENFFLQCCFPGGSYVCGIDF